MVQKRSGSVVSPEKHELTEAERREIFRQARAATERIAELNKDLDPEEVERLIDEAVEEVRQERYERVQREAEGRS